MNLEKDKYTQNKHIQAYNSLSSVILTLNSLRSRHAMLPLGCKLALWFQCAHGLVQIVSLNFLLREIYTCCLYWKVLCFFFSVEVSKISSHFLCASLLNTSSKTSKPDGITTFAEYCSKIAFWIKQNQMKDIPLTPGCTMFSVCTIKAAGTNETK